MGIAKRNGQASNFVIFKPKKDWGESSRGWLSLDFRGIGREEISRFGRRTGSCPTLNFNVNGSNVTTDASTEFEHGTCGQVQNGVQVEVEGLQVGSTIQATEVDIDD